MQSANINGHCLGGMMAWAALIIGYKFTLPLAIITSRKKSLLLRKADWNLHFV